MTLTDFLRAERDKVRRANRSRTLWRRSLNDAEENLWRCPVCGGWRYAMRQHSCPRTTGP